MAAAYPAKLVSAMHERSVEMPPPCACTCLVASAARSRSNPRRRNRPSRSVWIGEARVLQFGLFARALPTDKLATLMARLGALMGSDRVGAPSLVDTFRPGAFAMVKFDPPRIPNPQSRIPTTPSRILRRFRSPIAARVMVEQGRPTRVTTDRRGLSGGRVERCEGPWRSSGDWWKRGWNCDEWDVALTDGSAYRISQAHDAGAWFVEGLLD